MKLGELATPEQAKAKRRARAEAKAQTPTVRTEHKVPESLRRCTALRSHRSHADAPGKSTFVWEFVPARFVRHEHVQQVLRCRCGGCVITAPGAPKVVEKGQYGASFLAHIGVAKWPTTCRSTASRRSARKGVPVARSTTNELLHRASALLAPVWTRVVDVTRERNFVMADETRLRIMKVATGKPKTGFVWTFGAADAHGGFDVTYHFRREQLGLDAEGAARGDQRRPARRRVQRLQRRREGLEPKGRRLLRPRAALLLRVDQDRARRAGCARPSSRSSIASSTTRRSSDFPKPHTLSFGNWGPGRSAIASRPGSTLRPGVTCRRDRSASPSVHARPMGRAWRVPRRRAHTSRQQRLRACAPQDRTRQEQLPVRRRRRVG